MIWNRLIHQHWKSVIIGGNRPLTLQSELSLANQMKRLNTEKKFDQVVKLFETYQNSNVTRLSSMIVTQTLKAYAQTVDLQRGIRIHQLVSSRLKDDLYIGTSLIHLYMQCSDVKTSESLFNQSKRKDLSMYGAMMKGYITNKMFDKAIDLFHQIENPNDIILLLLFNACAQSENREKSLDLVKKVSSKLPKTFYSNPFLLPSLLDALMKCGDLQHAESLFNRSKTKSLSMYGAMMKGYLKNNLPVKAIELFEEIKEPDDVILIVLFNACAELKSDQALNITKTVSSKMKKSSYFNLNLLTSLLDALMKCGGVENAELLFNRSTRKNLSMYGAMMKGYITNKMFNKAIDLFHQIENPNEVILLLLFNACAQTQNREEALNLVKKISSKMPQSFYSKSHLATSFVDALMKCGDVQSAESFFNKLEKKDTSMYSAMMKGYIKNDMVSKAIDLFHQVKQPSEIILTLLFNACAQSKNNEALKIAKTVASKMEKNSYSNVHIATSMLDAFNRCNDLESAEWLFNQLTTKTLSMYGTMMKAYITHQMARKAIDIFHQIPTPNEIIVVLLFNACAQSETSEALDLVKKVSSQMSPSFHSNPVVITSLTDALMKCGDVQTAERIFHRTTMNDLSVCSAMMTGYIKNDMAVRAIDLFRQIKKKRLLLENDHLDENGDLIQSNLIVYLSVLNALCDYVDLPTSESIVQQIPSSFLVYPEIQNALTHMWGKIGSIEKAKESFENIPKPDHIGYTTMINAYGLNGMGTQAVDLFSAMPKELVTEWTHVCVLNACSHSGLVEQARQIFENISNKTERVYTTMIDCLSRRALFDEANEMIDRFEQKCSPSLPMYMALLSGSRNDKRSHVAQQVYSRMTKHFPESRQSLAAASILLANTYASSGDLEKASDIQTKLNQLGLKRRTGLSWTSPEGHFYRFRAHDRSHPRSLDIDAEVKRMSKELLQHGHEYDASWITRSIKANETIASVLCGHSEKLAIAWNFVINPKATRIQVATNLRICGDCHRATKLIALIRQCEIVVRDGNRIHRFSPTGQCSCHDYF